MEYTETTGRPRRFPWSCNRTFADREVEQLTALMGELVERTVDQVHDLPSDALLFRPNHVWFSIAGLALHMSASEYRQVRHLLPLNRRNGEKDGPQLESQLVEDLDHGDIRSDMTVPERLADGQLLAGIMRSVHRDFTIHVCSGVRDADARLGKECLFSTPRDLLAHMNWHWSYHSGQIGLLRLMWGDNYVWTMAGRQ